MSRAANRVVAWIALAAPALAWAVHHQVGSDLNYADCRTGNGQTVLAVGLGALLLVAIAASLGLKAWRSAGETDPTTRFIATIALMATALFGLTIIVQIGAGQIVPACFE